VVGRASCSGRYGQGFGGDFRLVQMIRVNGCVGDIAALRDDFPETDLRTMEVGCVWARVCD